MALLLAANSYANTWNQTAYIKASDSAAGMTFGVKMGISGNTMVVSASTASPSCTPASSICPAGLPAQNGAAYVFTVDPTGTWTQQAIMSAHNTSVNSTKPIQFGTAVAIDGNTLAVGAVYDGNTADSGAVFVYTGSGASWTQQAVLKSNAVGGASPDTRTRFGDAVAISGDTLVVGAFKDRLSATAPPSNDGFGAVYVFTRSGTAWTQAAKLTASDGQQGDWFGYSVAYDGTTITVGATTNNMLGRPGKVYTFTGSGSTWTQQSEVVNSAASGTDLMGLHVAIQGGNILAGAPTANVVIPATGSPAVAGTAITAPSGRSFGESISMSGSYAAIGAPDDTVTGGTAATPGTAFLYSIASGSWNLVTELQPLVTPAAGVNFGFEVALAPTANYVAVGAPYESSNATGINGNANDTSAPGAGAVYIFTNQVTIGGTAAGVTASGLTLQLNGANDLPVTQDGAFTFATPINAGTTYNVTVSQSPPGLTCTVANGSGTTTVGVDVTNVQVTCSPDAYTVGGTVGGLGSSPVSLQLNGSETLSVAANGTFTFATALQFNDAYAVTIATQPAGQTCAVTNGSGTVVANVTDVQVVCSSNSYTVGGTVSGLGSSPVSLQLNGGETLSVAANGTFTFATALQFNDSYAVTIATQPTGQTCTVTNGSGTIAANVTDVQVVCTTSPPPTYTVVSRATHGNAGTFDIPLDLTATASSAKLTVEPRSAEAGNVHRIVFTFGSAITSVGGVQLGGKAGSQLGTGTAGTPVIDSTNNTVTIALTNVPNRKRLQVTLTGINGVAGADATVALAYLLGDVTQDMLVTGVDKALTGANSPSALKATNFQFNVSLSGGITGLDAAIVGANSPNSVE